MFEINIAKNLTNLKVKLKKKGLDLRRQNKIRDYPSKLKASNRPNDKKENNILEYLTTNGHRDCN